MRAAPALGRAEMLQGEKGRRGKPGWSPCALHLLLRCLLAGQAVADAISGATRPPSSTHCFADRDLPPAALASLTSSAAGKAGRRDYCGVFCCQQSDCFPIPPFKILPKNGQKSSAGHIQTFCVLNHASKVKPKQEGLGICCSYSFANPGPHFEGCSGSSPREQVPQDILKIPCYITTFLRWTLRNPSIINITLMQKILRHFQREKLNYVHYSCDRKILYWSCQEIKHTVKSCWR